MYLKRYHDIEIWNSGVWRILKRLELNPLPPSQRHKPHVTGWKRYENPLPGLRVKIDVKFVTPLARQKATKKRCTAKVCLGAPDNSHLLGSRARQLCSSWV